MINYKQFELSDFKETKEKVTHCDMCHKEIEEKSQIFKNISGKYKEIDYICRNCHYEIEEIYIW